MKTKEVRAMGVEELHSKGKELEKDLFNLRLQNSAGQLENPLKLRFIRKDIARLKTILTEKENQA
ncbi:MAG: 50S ribosomal protein L29 [Deltaproteobacteria bacterium]|nr:50S ribosomal protein L29 [Deltaproteobacteria bacterium]